VTQAPDGSDVRPHPRRAVLAAALGCPALLLAATPRGASATSAREAQATLDAATQTVRRFRAEARARQALARCAGVLVVPRVTRVGLMVGGEFGDGVVLARRDSRVWSDPVFVRQVSASYGLQAGFKQYALMLVVMREPVVRAMVTAGFEFGSHMSYAAGDQGAQFEGLSTTQLADVYYFARTETGLFGGFSLEGSTVQVNDEAARAFFGGAAVPAATVLFQRAPSAAGARTLRSALAGGGGPGRPG
jgi:SH3 domain-containing YSC84-like protein 1